MRGSSGVRRQEAASRAARCAASMAAGRSGQRSGAAAGGGPLGGRGGTSSIAALRWGPPAPLGATRSSGSGRERARPLPEREGRGAAWRCAPAGACSAAVLAWGSGWAPPPLCPGSARSATPSGDCSGSAGNGDAALRPQITEVSSPILEFALLISYRKRVDQDEQE